MQYHFLSVSETAKGEEAEVCSVGWMVTQQLPERLAPSSERFADLPESTLPVPPCLPIGSIRVYLGTLSLTQGNRSLGKLRRSATRQTACTEPTVLTTPSTHHHIHIHERHRTAPLPDLDPVSLRLRPRRQR